MNIHFETPKPDLQNIVKIVGVGGGGNNATNYMYSSGISNVDFINCNTDLQFLNASPVDNLIQLGPQLTEGLGAGANPEIGKRATEESIDLVKSYLELNTKMVFITAGLGGGTGTGGAPVLAKLCRELGLLTIVIVTKPFSFEGKERYNNAEEGIKNLKQYADALIVVDNDKLFQIFGDLTTTQAFAKANDVLSKATNCILNIISKIGIVNVDFNDVNTVLRNSGHAILGYAEAEGDDRALKAVEEALDSPLIYDNNIKGAKHLLLNISSSEGDYEHKISEVNVIQEYIKDKTGDQVNTILGLSQDNSLEKKISVTIIAAGFSLEHEGEEILELKKESQSSELNKKIEVNEPDDKPTFIPTYGQNAYQDHVDMEVNNRYVDTDQEQNDRPIQVPTFDYGKLQDTDTDASKNNIRFIEEEEFKTKHPNHAEIESNELEETQKRNKRLYGLSNDYSINPSALDSFNNKQFHPATHTGSDMNEKPSDIMVDNQNKIYKNYMGGDIKD